MIEKGSDEWNRLFELAAVGHIPAGLLAEPNVGEKISVFFRMNSDFVSNAKMPIMASRVSAECC